MNRHPERQGLDRDQDAHLPIICSQDQRELVNQVT